MVLKTFRHPSIFPTYVFTTSTIDWNNNLMYCYKAIMGLVWPLAVIALGKDWTEDDTMKTRAYSKRVFRTNCALRIKKCAPRISSGIF